MRLIVLFYKNKYDIVHTHSTKAGILGRIAAKIAGVPVIVCGLHGSALQAFDNVLLNSILAFFERWTGQFTDAYISVCKNLSEEYKQAGIGVNSTYYTVYSGMDLERFLNVKKRINKEKQLLKIGIERGAFVIGNIARLERVKGHKYLIDALDILIKRNKDKKIVLLILREGQERLNLVNYVKNKDLQKNIIFAGFQKDIENYLALMDIIALSSAREGLPRVLVQAAAAGIPAVAFDIDGVSELITNGKNGFLVEKNDYRQLADRIMKYIDDKSLRSLHGENGENMVKGK